MLGCCGKSGIRNVWIDTASSEEHFIPTAIAPDPGGFKLSGFLPCSKSYYLTSEGICWFSGEQPMLLSQQIDAGDNVGKCFKCNLLLPPTSSPRILPVTSVTISARELQSGTARDRSEWDSFDTKSLEFIILYKL